MAIYGYSEQQIESMVSKARRVRVRFGMLAVLMLFASSLLALSYPSSPLFREPLRAWFFAAVTSIFLVPLWQMLMSWKKWPDKMRDSLKHTRVEVIPGSVIMSGPHGYKSQISTGEILRAEEPSLGAALRLRTSNRYRSILIPRGLDASGAIKNELAASGISVAKTTFATNWEEVAGVLFFIGMMIFSFTVHNIHLLTLNLILSVLLSAAWFRVINANSEIRAMSRLRWAKFGQSQRRFPPAQRSSRMGIERGKPGRPEHFPDIDHVRIQRIPDTLGQSVRLQRAYSASGFLRP